MRWIAKFIRKNKPDKYFTIYGDSINEASRIAENWCPKDYILITITEAVYA